MHFESADSFIDYFLLSQKFQDTPIHTTTDWQYDISQQITQVLVLNPFTEQSLDVQIANCNQQAATKLKQNTEKLFISSFATRVNTFNKPVQQVVASYNVWQDFRDLWLIRNGNNVAKASIPLLIDVQDRVNSANKNVFITLYVTPSKEYYRFVLPDQSVRGLAQLQRETTQIVEEAYA